MISMRVGFFVVLFLTCIARADQTAVLDTSSAQEGGTTTIEHGRPPQWTEYQVLDGRDEIFGTPEYDRRKAYDSWKTACNDWKQSMKEMNGERELLTLNCSSPSLSREGGLITYKSSGVYKMKIRTRERK
jgi:hypothetical protein